MKIFLYCLLLVLVHSTNSQIEPRIVKGVNAAEGEIPYQVALQATYNEAFICGGAIITDTFIMTASRCLDDTRSADEYFIVAGTNEFKKSGVIYYIETIIRHCNFDNPAPHNDIAFLRLNTTIKWSKTILPIRLRQDPLVEGEVLQLSGWGRLKFNVDKSTQKLQKIDLTYMPFTKCRPIWDKNDQLYKLYIGHVCAIKRGAGACRGDSGSPLVDKNKRLVGIANLARNKCDGISVHASIMYHMDWIYIILSKNSECNKCVRKIPK